MNAVPTRRIEAKTAIAFEVPASATLHVIDLEGGQVADLVAFVQDNPSEHFSQSCTRVNNWKMQVSVEDRLYSNRNTTLFTVVADSVGVHDLLFPCCSRYVYAEHFDGEVQDGCQERLTAALEPFGVPRDVITDPLNVFMHTTIDGDGQVAIAPPLSKAGDTLSLRAEVDCIVGISACPDDQSSCNASRCTAIGVQVTAGS